MLSGETGQSRKDPVGCGGRPEDVCFRGPCEDAASQMSKGEVASPANQTRTGRGAASHPTFPLPSESITKAVLQMS